MQNRPTNAKAAALAKGGDYLQRIWPLAALLCGIVLTAAWTLIFGYGVVTAVSDLVLLF